MAQELREKVEEIRRRLDGTVDGGPKAIRDRGFGHIDLGEYLALRAQVGVGGTLDGRAVHVDFRRAELEIDVASRDGIWMTVLPRTIMNRVTNLFGRPVRAGVAAFDDAFIVLEEGGAEIDDVVPREELRAAVEALAPFEHLRAKDRIVEGLFRYDRQAVTVEEVMARIRRLAAIAEVLETAG